MKENDDHQNDEQYGLEQGMDDGIDGFADEFGRVVNNPVFQTGREIPRQAIHFRLDSIRAGQRVRSGRLEHRHYDRSLAGQIGRGLIIIRTNLDPGHIADADLTAIGIGSYHDLFELRRIGKATLRFNAHLKGVAVAGGYAERTGGHLNILRAQGGDDLASRQAVGSRPVRVQPHPHRKIARAEHLDVADPFNSGQPILDAGLGIVGDIFAVERVVRADQVDHQKKVGRGFAGHDTEPLDFFGQAGRGDRDPVLDKHLGSVEIGARLEGHGYRDPPVAGRLAGKIQHFFHPVYFLLDRIGDGIRHGFRRGTRIDGCHCYRRRHDFRILRHRKEAIRDRPDQRDKDSDDHGKNRPVNEETGKTHIGDSGR